MKTRHSPVMLIDPGREDVLEEGPVVEPDEEVSAQLALQVSDVFSSHQSHTKNLMINEMSGRVLLQRCQHYQGQVPVEARQTQQGRFCVS